MKILVTALALAAQTPAPPASVTPDHQEQIACVATFAVIASQQDIGQPEALELPLLTERGREYAGIVGERVMQETGQSKEQVRDMILSAVIELQGKASTTDIDLPIAEMESCLSLLDQEVPAFPKPTLPQCAAMMTLAYEQIYAAGGLTKKAQDLKTLAFVLDSRARDAMKAQGKSATEMDMEMAAEQVIVGAPDAPEMDIDHCFALAAPEPKAGVKH